MYLRWHSQRPSVEIVLDCKYPEPVAQGLLYDWKHHLGPFWLDQAARPLEEEDLSLN